MFQTHKIQEMTATAAICWEEKQATREDKQMREEDGGWVGCCKQQRMREVEGGPRSSPACEEGPPNSAPHSPGYASTQMDSRSVARKHTSANNSFVFRMKHLSEHAEKMPSSRKQVSRPRKTLDLLHNLLLVSFLISGGSKK